MRREVTLEEISDGRLYEANDMVKACLLYTSDAADDNSRV